MCAGLACLGLIFAASSATAGTTVSGPITSNTIWTPDGSPYVLNGQITIAAGTTLTLVPGAVVKGRSFSGWLQVNGILLAQGTAAAPIVFTSERDDSVGGDTNGDGDRTWPGPGDWYGLQFTGTSSGNVLDHVVVRYGGYNCTNGTPCANVAVATSAVTLSNSEVTDSANYGVRVESRMPRIMSSTIARNSYGVYLNGSPAQISGNTISGNSVGLYAFNSSAPILNGNTFPSIPPPRARR